MVDFVSIVPYMFKAISWISILVVGGNLFNWACLVFSRLLLWLFGIGPISHADRYLYDRSTMSVFYVGDAPKPRRMWETDPLRFMPFQDYRTETTPSSLRIGRTPGHTTKLWADQSDFRRVPYSINGREIYIVPHRPSPLTQERLFDSTPSTSRTGIVTYTDFHNLVIDSIQQHPDMESSATTCLWIPFHDNMRSEKYVQNADNSRVLSVAFVSNDLKNAGFVPISVLGLDKDPAAIAWLRDLAEAVQAKFPDWRMYAHPTRRGANLCLVRVSF